MHHREEQIESSSNLPLVIAIENNDVVGFNILLNDKGTDINAQDRKGMTALMASIKYDHWVWFIQILGEKPDLDLEDKEGNTAMSYAMRSKSFMYKLYLQKRGENE